METSDEQLFRDHVKQLYWICRGIAEAFYQEEPSKKERCQESAWKKRNKADSRAGRGDKAGRSAVQERAARSAHLKLLQGLPGPPRIPRAAVTRKCCPQPSPWGAKPIRQPPWNRRSGSGRPRPVPSPATEQAAEAAAQSAAARAAVWRPWMPPVARQQFQSQTSDVGDDAPQSSPSIQVKSSSSIQVRPLSSRSLRGTSSFRPGSAIPSEMAQSLKSTFDFKVFSGGGEDSRNCGPGFVPRWKLHKLARDMNMTIENVLVAKEIFDHHDFDQSGYLTLEEVAKVIETLMEVQVGDKQTVANRIQSGQMSKLLNAWLRFTPEGAFELDFEHFLLWYSCTGFLADLLIDDREHRIRMLAKTNGLDALSMDRIRNSFTAFDVDRSGEVDYDEFRNLLREVMKVPAHLDIPESRIRYFWHEIDEDKSGKASFDEFLNFWLQQFGRALSGSQGQFSSLEDYYKSQRRIGAEYLDPPYDFENNVLQMRLSD
mmetsp:Transcript_57393/g.134371  ORF Transcript_57393/g.134371 Transcript_57393/m.134371 type:complete len:486 (+) Transcript_57393:38-1495(+)